MKYLKNLIPIIVSSSFFNAIYSLCILPIFLFFSKSDIPLFGWQGFIFVGATFLYLVRMFHRNVTGYVYSIGFISSAIVFMKVSAGNTIPTWIVLSIIAGVAFLTQEILSDSEMKKAEISRQIVISGSILSFFLWYTFLFGAVFVTTIHPLVLFVFCGLYTIAMTWVIMGIYRIPHKIILSGMVGWGIALLYRIIRFIPYTHITQAGILTLVVFYAIFLFKEVHYVRPLQVKPLLVRLSVTTAFVLIILVTAG